MSKQIELGFPAPGVMRAIFKYPPINLIRTPFLSFPL